MSEMIFEVRIRINDDEEVTAEETKRMEYQIRQTVTRYVVGADETDVEYMETR